MQKGIDLIADVFYSVLKDNPRAQLICVGPIIDLYGKFAALKLKRMMEIFPDRVFSRPEFTLLPPYIFGGAEFELIPSRDEPFGLVAVEFGRKGALGIGARVGGLGQMPGWWFTVESTTTKHLISQFKSAINSALSTTSEKRAEMRARSLAQRFPVSQWVDDIDTLQSTAIRVNSERQRNGGATLTPSSSRSLTSLTPGSTVEGQMTSRQPSRASVQAFDRQLPPSETNSNCPTPTSPNRALTPSSSFVGSAPGTPIESQAVGPGHTIQSRRRRLTKSRPQSRSSSADSSLGTGHGLGVQQIDILQEARLSIIPSYTERFDFGFEAAEQHNPDFEKHLLPALPINTERLSPNSVAAASPVLSCSTPDTAVQEAPFGPWESNEKEWKRLSLTSVVSDRKDFKLQNVDPFFTDEKDTYYQAFEKMLDKLDSKNSEGGLCIEDYLIKSEKDWFKQLHRARMGSPSRSTSQSGTPRSVRPDLSSHTSPSQHGFSFSLKKPWKASTLQMAPEEYLAEGCIEQGDFTLPIQYSGPNRLQRFMQRRVGDWQLYCLFLALVRYSFPQNDHSQMLMSISRVRSWQPIRTRFPFSQVR